MPKPKPKPREPSARKFQPHYSGDESEPFWKAVNKIDDRTGGSRLWLLAHELMNLESKVLVELAAAQKGRK